MDKTIHDKNDFHWNAPEFFLALLAGVVAVGGLWLFSGLLIGLLFL
jgi:hypothetical protein